MSLEGNLKQFLAAVDEVPRPDDFFKNVIAVLTANDIASPVDMVGADASALKPVPPSPGAEDGELAPVVLSVGKASFLKRAFKIADAIAGQPSVCKEHFYPEVQTRTSLERRNRPGTTA